ncbi:MAG: hypothetical protein HETSPECPRED_004555 [Heterodermia speciosa]|uniref:Uncharacterized protein n=1 Tax=Heterodermia speciosa TaxID=116794 RepID=A0A8H3F8N8_9LECA|nr:MAG: hypothetical protein HETSPECPRED_004555 [Heterodermia speciosa]
MLMLATLIGSGLASLDKRINTWHWDSCYPCGDANGRPMCCCDGKNTDDYTRTSTWTSTSTSVTTSTFAVATTVTSVPTTITATSTVRGTTCFPNDKGPPPNCIQTSDRNAGYCLCSGPVATSTAVPTTISTTVTNTAVSQTTLTTTSLERDYPTGTPGVGVLVSAHYAFAVFPFCNSTLQTILNPPTGDLNDLSCVAPYRCARW